MRILVVLIFLISPPVSLAQYGCPHLSEFVNCSKTYGCDREARLAFAQVLLDNDELLLAATPAITPAENDSYSAEIRGPVIRAR